MTSVSGNSGEPNGGVISLTIGFARTTIISLLAFVFISNTLSKLNLVMGHINRLKNSIPI